MSWIQKLYETYENCKPMIGAGSGDNEVPLLPICHTTQKAQVEIVLDREGNFRRARVIPKEEARTIIPCTESSGGRTSGEAPHPLCDKLQYVAGDYIKYGGEKKHSFEAYKELLSHWCHSPHTHRKAEAVYKYICKGSVVKDLAESSIFYTDEKGRLLKGWDKNRPEEIPAIFKVLTNISQTDVFIRWVVEIPGEPGSAVWQDPALYECWMGYYLSTKEKEELCYVKGIVSRSAEQHPAKIRNDGDKAKLISSNDISGFTFRGRFVTADQACTVGYDVTQKAHNVLRWLIYRQGYRRGEHAVVAWATSGGDIPDPLADPITLFGDAVPFRESEATAFTAQAFALQLKKKIAGYAGNLGETDGIVVVGLDSATPGRMAITYYRELKGSDFLDRLDSWHEECAWLHSYRVIETTGRNGKKEKIRVRFTGAPAPGDIAESAYGTKLDDKLRRSTVDRILPCIIDGQRIPADIVMSVVRRASNRSGMEDWEWNKALSIACALYRKYKIDYQEEEIGMALDENRRTRDYLYGRLLALADSLEQWALNQSGEDRPTNAARLMQRFADRPYSTWRTIELALKPYIMRLGAISQKRQAMITEVMTLFNPEDFLSDRKLEGEFLLGYHCQREALWRKHGNETETAPSK